ncbi:hypothetical protein OSB04_028861 [Centaurea solstitialis]|uniref:Geraniol synthase n=1 Tax=Centaurea solstitialis TaxID=347529 RepID=A0AA38SGL4_9ASTR|nr:hypothetical protein OSB04_028861 [Centaurea solstitialis]
MSSPFYINSLSKTTKGGFTSNIGQHPWRLLSSSSPCKSSSRVCRFMVSLPRATIAMPLTHANNFLLANGDKTKANSSPEVDVLHSRIDELNQKTRKVLMATSNPKMKMKLLDTIQRLGIGYSYDEEIIHKLIDPDEGQLDDDLCTVALRFRLQRTNGLHTNSDVFGPFLDANGKFKESSIQDIETMLSLFEASYLGANGEDILSHAKEFTTIHLMKSVPQLTPTQREDVLHSLELPRHLRMARLESRRYIEEYGNESDHIPILLELAKLEYNQVQSLHQMELAEITRWWRHLGLVTKLTFARDRPLECFLWSVGLLPESKYSAIRIELAKTISILLVIDDIFDTYGSYDDLVLFTKAIQRWDLNEMEHLPEYMKICYMALYNTTNEICFEVLKKHGLSVLPFLRKTWIDMVEAFMVEAEWRNGGNTPNLKEYIENGVTTAGTYMAMVHLFFLMGEGVTIENMRTLHDSYPSFFSVAGTILRLWDDLGTSKEEQERGDVESSIQLVMKEKNITSEEEGRKQILHLIHTSWKELNATLVTPDALPLSIIKVALNMSRASQVIYQHDQDTYFSGVDDHVKYLFFTPIDM